MRSPVPGWGWVGTSAAGSAWWSGAGGVGTAPRWSGVCADAAHPYRPAGVDEVAYGLRGQERYRRPRREVVAERDDEQGHADRRGGPAGDLPGRPAEAQRDHR